MKTASTVAAFAALFALPKLSLAAEGEAAGAVAVPATPAAAVPLGPPPTDFELKFKDYYADCAQVIAHMRYAVQLEKGNPVLPEVSQLASQPIYDSDNINTND